MKQMIFIILPTLFISLCKSQTNVYHPFLHEGAEWNQLQLTINEENSDTNAYFINFISKGDSNIDGKNYIKIFVDAGEFGSALQFMLRDDTSNKQVYFYNYFDDIEVLLYDFNVTIGTDVITFPDFNSLTEAIVFNIDSIEIDGNYRKRIGIQYKMFYSPSFEYVNDTCYWIEGIGNTAGLITPILEGESIPDILTCYLEDENLKYSNLDYWYTCDSILIDLGDKVIDFDANNQPDLHVFPNPVINSATLNWNIQEWDNTIQLDIINVTGVKIISYFIPNSGTFKFQKNGLPPGLYFVYLSDIFNDAISPIVIN